MPEVETDMEVAGRRSATAEARPPKRPSASAKAGDVVGDGLDLAVAHLRGDADHLRAVVAGADAEGGELRLGVVGMLARQPRVLRWNAAARGAVAAGAGWNVAIGDAAAVDLLTELNRVLALREAGFRLLRGVERS